MGNGSFIVSFIITHVVSLLCVTSFIFIFRVNIKKLPVEGTQPRNVCAEVVAQFPPPLFVVSRENKLRPK